MSRKRRQNDVDNASGVARSTRESYTAHSINVRIPKKQKGVSKVQMRKPEIVMVPIDQIKPYERNPRKNDDAVDPVAESIREYGFKSIILLNPDGVIIYGHTRWKAAKKVGLKELPCWYVDDLTDEQIREYRIADNSTGEVAEWDLPLLKLELDGLPNFDAASFGLDMSWLDNHEEEEPAEAQDDDYDPDPPEIPVSKPGQIYQLGRHRLMCGNSTKLEDVAKLVDGQKIDLLLTDPPYNVDYHGTAGTIENDNFDTEEAFLQFLCDAFAAGASVLKPGAVFYIWHADSEGENFRRACREKLGKVRQCLIWAKSSLVLDRQDYQWKHEPCLYGWTEGSHYWGSDRKQTTVMEFDKPRASKEHPTMKPIPLFDYQIRNSARIGESVLDLFGGSGTTIMACEQNNRNAYVMEFDPKYVDVIIHRWETFTGKTATLICDSDPA